MFNSQQPGCTYYYLPLSIYNLGVVNHAFDYGDNSRFDTHMDAHVYHEGVAKKGSNNVVSLILKSLKSAGIMRENDIGGELILVFDNCSGQNKNNMVLKMLVWLVEVGYFKKVELIFLIVGHTKNAADRLFNMLKKLYRLRNLYTMEELITTLNYSQTINVVPAVEEDFEDWESFFDLFYSDFKGKVKKSYFHLLHCHSKVQE